MSAATSANHAHADLLCARCVHLRLSVRLSVCAIPSSARGVDGGETATGVHGQKALEKAGVGVGRSGVSMRKYARWI